MEKFSITNSNNIFAADLYHQLRKSDKNLFISPLSIFTALTMVYAGAKAATEEELRKVLHLFLPQRSIPLKIKELIVKLLNIKNTEINIANSIWTDRSYEILESFLYIIDENYEGALFKEVFQNIDETCNKINAWVSEKTKQKIVKIIGPDIFNPSIALILLNAIYFNGKWEKVFKKELTQETPFNLLNGTSITVQMMHQKGEFSYFEDEALQILELPYLGNKHHYSMIILLPKDKYGLKDIEEILSSERIQDYRERLWSEEVKIYIPKFKIETRYELKEDLKEMGMKLSFSPSSDFSGIVDISNDPPYINEVIHKAYIEVNEKGTEAAAVTMITALPKGIPVQRDYRVFKADHPFLFLIQDSETQTIIFLGKVLNPLD